MYTTTDIMREMLEIGMIDKEEYAEMVSEYRNHFRAITEMDLMTKKAKETIDRIKEQEESKQEESDPKYEKLCDAYLNGYISEEDFRRMSRPMRRKKPNNRIDELNTYGATSAEYVGYMTGRLKKN